MRVAYVAVSITKQALIVLIRWLSVLEKEAHQNVYLGEYEYPGFLRVHFK